MTVTVNTPVAGGDYIVVSGGLGIQTSPTFSVAGTYIIALGPCRALSVILDTSVVGTIVVYDNTAASGPTLLASTITAVGSNIVIPINADATTGITIVVTGNNVGKVTFKELE